MSKAIDPALFRETLGHYPTGVAVVTAVPEDGEPIGMVVGTFSSVSLDPPLIAFLPATNSRRFAKIRTARAFCVNVLASDQEPLCRRLATGGAGSLEGVRWRPGILGSPILEEAQSWIECTFDDIREAGDHFIVLGLVHELAVARSTLPLLFFQGGYGRFSPGSYASLAAGSDPLQPQQTALTAFELSDRLPRHKRAVRQATSDLADRFCPDLVPGELYDLASIVVPVPTKSDLPPMAIRMTSLPTSLRAEQTESWAHRLIRF